MKTQEEIQLSINKVRHSIEPTFKKALFQFQNGEYSECAENLFTLMANISALEAAQRIID